MNTLKQFIPVLLALMLAGCASFKSDHEVRSTYWTEYGYVTTCHRAQPGGKIELWAWSEKESPDDFLLAEWQKRAQQLAHGRKIEGSPAVKTYDHGQAARMWNREDKGEKHEGKRAEGVISFVP